MNAAKKSKTREISRSNYTIYLKKANEFYQTMYQAEKVENWNAAGLNGVHAIISLIDALLVKYKGIRSAEEDHNMVIKLFNSSIGNIITDVKSKGSIARRIIAKKNLIAYENREFLKSEALGMLKQVERFYQWAVGFLK